MDGIWKYVTREEKKELDANVKRFKKRKSEGRALINSIVKFINSGDIAARASEPSLHFWSVLSALRGPDAPGSEDIKMVTTARLRSSLGLKEALGVHVSEGEPEILSSSKIDVVGTHFAAHMDHAMFALKFFGFPNKK